MVQYTLSIHSFSTVFMVTDIFFFIRVGQHLRVRSLILAFILASADAGTQYGQNLYLSLPRSSRRIIIKSESNIFSLFSLLSRSP